MRFINTVCYTLRSDLFKKQRQVVVQIASKQHLTDSEALEFLKNVSEMIAEARVISVDILSADVWDLNNKERKVS